MPLNETKNILLVDDEIGMRMMLSTYLKKEGYTPHMAEDGLEAMNALTKNTYSAVITDLNMPRADGMSLLKHTNEKYPNLPVIVMSAYGSTDSALKAMHAGAFDYVFKPFQPDEIIFSLRKAEEQNKLKKENEALKQAIGQSTSFGLVYKSKVMSNLMELVEKVAQSDGSVLLTGESGSGKELIARAVHKSSSRKNGPFVAINCGAISESLLESELFGHIRGAFTGATRDREGLFRAADGGTLFLDEIGELPLGVQVKLLRAIQFSEIRPVGGEASIKIDVRIVAATGRPLEEMVKEHLFREDLYYRINVLPLQLPPLRNRPEDISLLAGHFLYNAARRLGRQTPSMSLEFLDALSSYNWPGNVRELENLMDRLLVMAGSHERLELSDLPSYFNSCPAVSQLPVAQGDLNLKNAVKRLEADYIDAALQKSSGNRSEAARLLGVSYPNLLSKIKEYKLS